MRCKYLCHMLTQSNLIFLDSDQSKKVRFIYVVGIFKGDNI